MNKKTKWITSLVSAMVLSLSIGVGSALIPNKVDATESVVADVNAFYSSSGEKLTGTAEWESKSSGSGVAYSQFAKQGIVWNYDKGETITYDGLIDLSDNTINDARNLADSIFEGYGLWASTMAENKAEWGANVYETQLTFRFEDYLNSENYFDIVIADSAASYGYIAAMANNHAYRTDASKSKGQSQGAIRWGGTGTNTKGLVPADGLNVSSTQAFAGWGLYYQIGIAGYNANCINLSYNVEENAAFCRAFWGGSDYLCYIRDFGTVYDNYAWAGFTDPSKVKLKITCNNGHGALLIKSVDGKSLAYNTEPTVEAHKGSATFTNQNGLNVAKNTTSFDTITSNANGVDLSTFKNKGVVLDYAQGTQYKYNKTIDLSDNNVNSLLFEGYGLVAKENNANFSIVFSEKNNPSNYFEVKMEDLQLSEGYWDGTANKSVSYIASSATGLSQGGYRMSSGSSFIGNRQLPAMYQYIKNNDGTYSESSSYQKAGWTNAPFVGLNGNSLDTIRLFYDKEMNAIFYEARWYGNAWNTLICLRDFDGVLEGGTTWSGFSNASEIEVTIKGNTGSGSLLVMNVDGESLATDETFKNATHAHVVSTNATVTDKTGAVVNSGAYYEVKVGDTLTFTPGVQTLTGASLSDVRTFSVNGTNYNYDEVNKSNNANLPLTLNGDSYIYTVTADDVSEGLINISAKFDKYCKATFVDEFGNSELYAWTDSTIAFPYGKINYNSINTGNSNGTKMLLGYLRKDIGKDATRTDGFTYDYNSLGSLYNTDIDLGNLTASGVAGKTEVEKAYTIVNNMEFEAIYVEFNVRTEIKLSSNTDGSVNENYTGLRFVIEVNKEDWNKFLSYSKSATNAGKFSGVFYNYLTTVSQLEKVGITDSYESIGLKWQTNGSWDPTLNNANDLGLTCLGFNGESVANTNNNPAFITYKLQESSADIWLDADKNVNTDNDKYYAYALTVRNFKSITQTYVLSILMNSQYITGDSIGLINAPVSVNLGEVCGEKYDKVINNATEETTATNLYRVSIDGSYKYVSITLKHLQWLNEKGDLGHTIVA